ncbi:helix-turn-helix transcriptional regulator [Clostridia bacterium OttesenSCG-928-O13]|nr:helix-turn-helix transcriptional regulator [Clostridia bacterium OttesenSCG-928-O13]
MEFDRALFAARLRAAREGAGLSQVVLSELAGLRRTAVGDFEQGKHMPSAEGLYGLAGALGVSCDYLLGVENILRD